MIGYVEGADIYLIVALLIFMLVFVVAAVYMVTLKKEHEEKLANMPLSNSKSEEHEK